MSIGRIRSIKPEILEDERTAALTHEGFRVFVSLIVLADDYGNFRAHPKQLDASIFWARESDAGIESLLSELVSAKLVHLYEVRGQRYGHLNGWSKNQKVDHPGKPRVPGPPEDTCDIVAKSSRDIREPLAPDQDQDLDHERDPRAREAWFEAQSLSAVEIPGDAALPEDFRAVAAELSIADVEDVFAVFKGKRRDKREVSWNWLDNWRAWLVRERKFQQRDREKARAQNVEAPKRIAARQPFQGLK